MTTAQAPGGSSRRWRGVALGLVVVVAALALGAWLYLYQTRRPDFADVAYQTTSPSQRLDLYVPRGKGPFPLVIFAHGGAFKFGDKTGTGPSFYNDVTVLNDAGIAFATINYRMSGEARFPAAVRDMKSALRYLRAHASQYHLDSRRIALWGQSAGANIALVTGMSNGVARFDDPRSQWNAMPDTVSAIVSMYGPTDFLQMDAQLKTAGCAVSDQNHNAADSPESLYLGGRITGIPAVVAASDPLTYASPATPPLLLQHGTADCTVPPLQSRILADKVNAAAGAGRATLQFRQDAHHADSAFDTADNLKGVVAFLMAAFQPVRDRQSADHQRN